MEEELAISLAGNSEDSSSERSFNIGDEKINIKKIPENTFKKIQDAVETLNNQIALLENSPSKTALRFYVVLPGEGNNYQYW